MEIKVKKENVLKAYSNIGRMHEGESKLSQFLKDLFPDVFEEEKKESELKFILAEPYSNVHEKYKKIMALAKRKVDGCDYMIVGRAADSIKQKLDEM